MTQHHFVLVLLLFFFETRMVVHSFHLCRIPTIPRPFVLQRGAVRGGGVLRLHNHAEESPPSFRDSEEKEENTTMTSTMTSTRFNPFATTTTMTTLRDLKMKELNQQLLQCITREQIMQVLEQHHDFLLEPHNHTQPQKLSYIQTMNQRIQQAKQEQVRTILTTMRDYVSSFL